MRMGASRCPHIRDLWGLKTTVNPSAGRCGAPWLCDLQRTLAVSSAGRAGQTSQCEGPVCVGRSAHPSEASRGQHLQMHLEAGRKQSLISGVGSLSRQGSKFWLLRDRENTSPWHGWLLTWVTALHFPLVELQAWLSPLQMKEKSSPSPGGCFGTELLFRDSASTGHTGEVQARLAQADKEAELVLGPNRPTTPYSQHFRGDCRTFRPC